MSWQALCWVLCIFCRRMSDIGLSSQTLCFLVSRLEMVLWWQNVQEWSMSWSMPSPGMIILLLHWLVVLLLEVLWPSLVLVREHLCWRWLLRTVNVACQRHTCLFLMSDHSLIDVVVFYCCIAQVLPFSVRYLCICYWCLKCLKVSEGSLHEKLLLQILFQKWVAEMALNLCGCRRWLLFTKI